LDFRSVPFQVFIGAQVRALGEVHHSDGAPKDTVQERLALVGDALFTGDHRM
jgi:hypothetical protein